MRILWSSNGPHVNTGYGNQTRYMLRAIKRLGYDVACLSWWGLNGGTVQWEGIDVFPGLLDVYGNDAGPHFARRWHADLLITLIDLWVMNPALGTMGGARWCPWFPIDCEPIPAPFGERFATAHRLLVYSRWGERLVREFEGGRYADRVVYLPHGVDCSVYRPADNPEDRAEWRKSFFPDWPEDAFVVGMVAANKGYPSRKSFPEVMEAFKALHAKHPEARLYLHSVIGPEMQGPPLDQMAKFYGITEWTRFANPMLVHAGNYSDEQMRQLYASMDVLASPSQGEGFGLPIVEAQSCGTPVIVTDFSAMSELVGDGWRVPPLRLQPTLIWGQQALADVGGVYHAMEEALRRPRSPAFHRAAREFAQQFDWPNVIERYWAPWLAEMDHGRSDAARELREGRWQNRMVEVS